MYDIGLILLAGDLIESVAEPSSHTKGSKSQATVNSVRTALESHCRPVVYVMREHDAKLAADLEELHVIAVAPSEEGSGLGVLIRTGLNALPLEGLDGVIIAEAGHRMSLGGYFDFLAEERQRTHRLILASQDSGSVCKPAFFARELFPQLSSIPASGSCSMLFERFAGLVGSVPRMAADQSLIGGGTVAWGQLAVAARLQ